MNRRAFLRGLGGALLALPTLEACSRPAAVTGRGAALGAAPALRLLTFGIWNGVIPGLWYPKGGSETSFQLGPMLAPLAPHQSSLILLKGLDNLAAIRTPGANGHAEGVSSLLSGYGPIEFPKGSNNWHGQGRTIDQVIKAAQTQAGALTRYGSIEVGVPHTGGGYGALSYADRDQPNNPATSPESVFALLFKDAQAGAEALARARARRKSVLDGSIEDYQRLAGRVSGEDRRRIDAHLQALRELEQRLLAAPACDPGGYQVKSADLAQTWRSFLDIAVLAMACDLTRLFSFSFDHAGGGGQPFPFLGVADDWHELSHQVVGEPDAGPATDKFVKIHQWFAGELKYLVDRLKATTVPEGGTLFDRTVILRGSELGINHTHRDIPFLILAGDKTPLRTGRYLDLAPGRPLRADGAGLSPAVPHNDLLLTLLHAFGVPGSSFGDPTCCSGDLDSQLLSTT